MNDLRALLDGGVPVIAANFGDRLTDAETAQVRADGLDVAELRIDRYRSYDVEHVVRQARRFRDLPTIATIRTADEGGSWSGSDDERLGLFESVLPEVDGIDIELASKQILPRVADEAHRQHKVVIVSHHDFDTTPSTAELDDIAHRAKASGADFVKVAAMTQSIDDLRTLARFTLHNAALGLIVVAMGTHGSMSRIFFPALGSRLTYAYGPDSPPVPGQMDFRETFELMRKFSPEFSQKHT